MQFDKTLAHLRAAAPPPPPSRSLPWLKNTGYWRGDITKTYVHECLDPRACVGGRGMDVSSPGDNDDDNDDSRAAFTAATATTNTNTITRYDESRYCVKGHKGAYCSVCADGFRRLSGGQLCKSCAGDWGRGVRAVLWVFAAVALLLLITLVVYLIGGATALSQARLSFIVVGAKT